MSGADPAAAHQTQEAFLDIDEHGTIVAANEASVEATGDPVSALLGRHFHLLVAPEHAGLVARQFERKRQDRGLETSYVVDLVRPDGSRRRFEVRSYRLDEPRESMRIRVSAHPTP